MRRSNKTKRVFGEVIDPFFHEFHLKDVLQVIIGASILAIPVGFTDEVWKLGEILPIINIFGFIILSLLFISLFTYYHYHKEYGFRYHQHFTRRVVLTYLVAFFIVALILTLIQKAPWQTDWILAFKRIALITFPASMSGAIADVIK